MTVPPVPLPSISDLFHAVGAPLFTGQQWAGSSTYAVRVYRQGSLALAAGIDAIRKAAEASTIVVWLPDYFCNEALDPIRQLPVLLRFYPIREDLTPNWPTVEQWAESELGSQVFILVHYFGFPNATKEARDFCNRHGMMLLEDAAHVLLPGSSVGLGDLMVFSPRKLLAVPSGGILVSPRVLATHFLELSPHPRKKDTLRWLGRRLAQQLFVWLHVPWHFLWLVRQNGPPTREIRPLPPPDLWACDTFTLRLLSIMEQNIDEVAQLRRRNYVRLRGWLDDLIQARSLSPVLPDDLCPYAFPLLIKERTDEILTRLQASGIPASRWPDLPPEVLTSKGEHEVAIRTYEHLLLLPVHQSLTLRQIDIVGQGVRAAIGGTS